MNNKILLAEIINTKGLKGKVKLRSYTQNLLSIQNYTLLDDNNVSYTLLNAYLIKDCVIANVNGINNKEEAAKLIGKKLYVLREALPPLESDNFYVIDLVGLMIFNDKKVNVGVVQEVYNFGAEDILEIKLKSSKSFMLPFNEETIISVDVEKKQIIVSDIYKEYT